MRSYSRVLAQHLAGEEKHRGEITPEFAHLIYLTSPLHDIGKVGIPDCALLKPGRLSDREFEIMKTHTTLGAQTLDAALRQFPEVKFLRMGRDIAATHHERYDGTGYPKGLGGENIPLCGRIVAFADVYDALTSKRVYKAAYAHDVAKPMLVEESGAHFDPAEPALGGCASRRVVDEWCHAWIVPGGALIILRVHPKQAPERLHLARQKIGRGRHPDQQGREQLTLHGRLGRVWVQGQRFRRTALLIAPTDEAPEMRPRFRRSTEIAHP